MLRVASALAILIALPCGHADLFPAPADPDPDLGLHLHGVVADGPLRLRLVRPWRLHGRRRLCAGAAVELLRPHAVARHSARRRGSPCCWPWSSAIPVFARRVVGHYFALVTLALSQVVLLSLVAAREITGGSLGFTPEGGRPFLVRAAISREESTSTVIALVLWLVGLVVWQRIDRGIGREALEAISARTRTPPPPSASTSCARSCASP